MRRLIVNNKESFKIPQYEFFKGVEIVESKYLPDNCFLVFEGTQFMDTTTYVFRYIDGELRYHKVNPVWRPMTVSLEE